MNVKRRGFLKVAGAVVGLGSISLLLLSRKSVLPPVNSDEYSEKKLIIDENSEQYVYIDGYIVEVSR